MYYRVNGISHLYLYILAQAPYKNLDNGYVKRGTRKTGLHLLSLALLMSGQEGKKTSHVRTDERLAGTLQTHSPLGAMRKKKILFLLSDTGGGHRASAMAISEAIETLYPGRYEILIEDVWKRHMPSPISRFPDTYGWITGPGMPIWAVLWKLTYYRKMQRLMFASFAPLVKNSVAAFMRKEQPDLVVSVHPLMNHLGLQWRESAGLNVPFITVVTDMVTLHSSWICPEVDRCLVPTEKARMLALELGMPKEKLAVHGQPVGLKFNAVGSDKRKHRQLLGIDPDTPTILIVGGGEGTGQIYRIARRIAKTIPYGQMLVVTGRNQRLKTRMDAVAWSIPTQVYGFVDNMPELMGAADLLVTKAGPGTISEAFIIGLPLILSGYIRGQEAGNVAYVKEHKAGAYAATTRGLTSLARDWLDVNNPILQELARNASLLARPNASLDIATDICKLV